MRHATPRTRRTRPARRTAHRAAPLHSTPLRSRYVSTAADHRQKRHGYKLLPDYVYVAVKTIIQEHGLEFQHEGRASSNAECTLGDADHTRILQHNFATYM